MVSPLFLLLGIFGLWLGSDLFVRNAKRIARSFAISELFIGLTIASIGTSIPEIMVSICGALNKLKGMETSGIVVGDTVGSMLNQITLILGITGLFTTLYIKKRELKRDGLMLIFSILIFSIVGYDGILTKLDGLAMILAYLVYFIFLISDEMRMKEIKEKKIIVSLKERILSILLMILGIIIVVLSTEMTVKGAVKLAEIWNVSQTIIGIVIVGLGTGLPELSVSLAAVLKGVPKLAIGNLIGSNITDMLFSIGIGILITNFNVDHLILKVDIPFLLLSTLILLGMFKRGLRLERKESTLLLFIYIFYIFIRFFIFT